MHLLGWNQGSYPSPRLSLPQMGTAVSVANGIATKISAFPITNGCWFHLLTANRKGRCYPPLPLKRLWLPHGKTVWPPMPAKQLYIMRPQNGAASFVAISTTNGRCCPPLTVNGHHLTPTPPLHNIKCKAFCILLFTQIYSKSKIRIWIESYFENCIRVYFHPFRGKSLVKHWYSCQLRKWQRTAQLTNNAYFTYISSL